MTVFIAKLPPDQMQGLDEKELTALYRKALGPDIKIQTIRIKERGFSSELTLEQLKRRYAGQVEISTHPGF